MGAALKKLRNEAAVTQGDSRLPQLRAPGEGAAGRPGTKEAQCEFESPEHSASGPTTKLIINIFFFSLLFSGFRAENPIFFF